MARPRDQQRRNELADRLADEIDSVISQRLAKISDPSIRMAIEEKLRDQVYENMGDALSGKIGPVVDESFQQIISSIQIKPGAKRRAGGLSSSFGGKDGDSGGKDDSGGKTSSRRTYTPRYSSGGKDSGGK